MNDFIKSIVNDKRKLYSALGIALGLGLSLIVVVFILIINARPVKEIKDDISPEKELEIITEIVKNNPQGIVIGNLDEKPQVSVSSDAKRRATEPIQIKEEPLSPVSKSKIPAPKHYENGQVEKVTPEDNPAPDISRYNFRTVTSVTYPGAAYNSCSNYMPIEDNPVVAVYQEYFDNNHSYHTYTRTYNDQLDDFSLGLYGSDIHEYYSYAGGSIYAKMVYTPDPDYTNYIETPDSYTQEPVSYTVPEYFGYNSSVVDNFVLNGRSYYVVEFSYEGYCNTSGYSQPDKTFIIRMTVDSSDYAIVESAMYIDSVNSENLISREEIAREEKTITLDEANAIFRFTYEGSQQLIDYTAYEFDINEHNENIKDYLNESDFTYVLPSDPEFDQLVVYGRDFPSSQPEGIRYYLQREYYPETERGQKRFDLVMESFYNSPLVVINTWNENNDSLTIEIFPKELTPFYLLNSLTNGSPAYQEEVTLLTINESQTSVLKRVFEFEYFYSYPVSYMDSYPVSYPNSYGGFTYYAYTSNLAFSNYGYSYKITGYGKDEWIADISYKMFDRSDESFERIVTGSTIDWISSNDGLY